VQRQFQGCALFRQNLIDHLYEPVPTIAISDGKALEHHQGASTSTAHNHLHRYVAEFDFRYNNRKALGVEDSQRADKLLQGFVGKRLTYETTTV
jgi:hypothetical protein